MSGHTPGPWSVQKHNRAGEPHYALTVDSDTRLIAEVGASPTDSHDEANARLIALAPEMIEALRCVMFHLDHRPVLAHRMDLVTHDEREKIRAIIRRAEGGE